MADISVSFQDVTKRALEIRSLYGQLEVKKYGRRWSREELALGFAGDVGDLMKLVVAEEGARDIADSKARLAHELADCLWSVLALAHEYDIDLQTSFFDTMAQLHGHINEDLRL